MRVLIADDDPTIRAILQQQVSNCDFECTVAADGQEAFDVLDTDSPPEIAVLDWMMPGIDGVEVCRRIKDKYKDRFIYILLLTSKNRRSDVTFGLDMGADDYLTKPVNSDELRSRLEVGRRTVQYDRKLREYATQMETLAEERARQLVHAERMSTLGRLSAGIVHEINNPVGFISTNAQMLQRYCEILNPVLRDYIADHPQENGKLEMIIDDLPAMAEAMQDGVKRIAKIISRLKEFSRKGDDKAPLNINRCVGSALDICANQLKYDIRVEKELNDNLPFVMADRAQIEQVLVNLIVNAADAMENRKDQRLRIRSRHDGDAVVLEISDNGPGVPEEIRAQIWDSFFTTKPSGKGTGLGLSISQEILENHGGLLTYVDAPGGGACFSITLPVMNSAK